MTLFKAWRMRLSVLGLLGSLLLVAACGDSSDSTSAANNITNTTPGNSSTAAATATPDPGSIPPPLGTPPPGGSGIAPTPPPPPPPPPAVTPTPFVAPTPPPSPRAVAYFMGNGNIQAYNLDTGAPLWQKDLSGATSSNAQPVVANGLVYFVAFDGYLQARDAHTGVLVWHSTVLSSTLYPPLVTSSMVYATFPKDTTHGTLTALDAHTGAVKWQRAVLRGDYTPILWNGMLWLTENFNGPTVTFNAFDPTTGQSGQVVTFNNLPFTGEAQQIVNGLAFLNCNSSNSFCGVDLTSGKVLWQISDGYSFYDPWYANGTVYLHTKQGLFAVNPTTGQQVFAYKLANSGGVNLENRVPLVANNAVYFTVNGDYIAVNATTGKLLWTSHNPEDYYAQGTYFDGKIVSPGSSVTALNANDGILAWHLPSQPGYPSLVGLGSW